ncbi:MAG TPA: hypothetical protein VIF08_08400 [Candidatus Limnocylindrales bacterium]|jgi:hypothetical protein
MTDRSAGREPQTRDDGDDAQGGWRRVARSVLTLRWVPLAAALLSLPLSAAAILISLQQPEVLVILPDQVRVAQGHQSGAAYLYLQPAFVSTGRSERIEVIRDMRLEVSGPGEPTDLEWTQQLRLVSQPGGGLSYEYVGDAVPLLVSPRDAAAPLALFEAPQGWFFTAGDYTFKLVADRVITGQPLTDEFTVSLDDADIQFLDEPGTERFLTFPID